MNKNLLKYLSVALLSFVLGMIWYKKRWFPIKQISHWRNPPKLDPYIYKLGTSPKTYREFLITKYHPGLPLFSDRTYHDTVKDHRLNDFYLIQIPRHYFKKLKIKIEKPLRIYRALSEKNDNTVFKDWSSSPIPINVKGNSCIHDKLVYKDFQPGIIELDIGGPTATSPIFIQFKGENRKEFGLSLHL